MSPKIQRSPSARPRHLGAAEVPPPPPEVTETAPEVEEPGIPEPWQPPLDTTTGNTVRRPNKTAYSHDSATVRHPADDYPTPGGFVRPLLDWMDLDRIATVWDPCAGGGHLVSVLREYFDDVRFNDLHYSGDDFLRTEPPRLHPAGFPGGEVDWIITNPPYKHAEAFARHALKHARNVAFLLNTAFLEGVGRSEGLFTEYPPSYILMCNRRMRMPDKKSSTFSHVWVIWQQGIVFPKKPTQFSWLPVKDDLVMPSGKVESVWP